MVSTITRPTMTEEKKYIYFNPNFCINNINVKDLVERAESVPTTTSSIVNVSQITCFDTIRVTTLPTQNVILPASEIHLPNLLPPPISSIPCVPPTGLLAHPGIIHWDPKAPKYAANLTSLARDYIIHPKETESLKFCHGSQLPMLSRSELLEKMKDVFNKGNAPKGWNHNVYKQDKRILKHRYLNGINKTSEFVRYMLKLENEVLCLDFNVTGSSYQQCKAKRNKMKKVGVNRFNFVSEAALDDVFQRTMRAHKARKQPNRLTNLASTSWSNPAQPQICTSQLTAQQRKNIFRNQVFRSGKNRFIKFDDKLKFRRNPIEQNAPQPTLMEVDKFKLVSINSSRSASRKIAVRQALKYIRKRDPIHQDCRFYLKSGRCRFGTRCIRKHDPSKLPTNLKKRLARSRPKSAFTVDNTVQPSHSSQQPSHTVQPSHSSQRTASDFKLVLNRQQSQKAPTIKRNLAHKKIVNKALRWKRKTESQKSMDCMYYIKRGECRFGDKCRRRHDPDKVAVCTQYLQENCTKSDCLFQHKIVKDKMPLCLFFLIGRCSKESCPYLHVNTGLDVPVCENFTKGHCDQGAQCEHRHTFHCERFFECGKCVVEGCKLRHERGPRLETDCVDADRPYFAGDDFIPVREEETFNHNQISLEEILAEFGDDINMDELH